MDSQSPFLRNSKENLGHSISTQRQSNCSERSPVFDKQLKGDENCGPIPRLALKKQLIELREDKSNYDVLFARYNGLQHKQKLLEEDRAKARSQFETRQKESQLELESLTVELAAIKQRNEAKEKEIAAAREQNERMIQKLASYEEQIKESATGKEREETRLGAERAVFEELIREKAMLEEEQRSLQRKAELTEEEIAEVEAQIKALAKTEKELADEMALLAIEIKRAEGHRQALEATAERQSDFLKTKIEEKDALETKLALAERTLEEQTFEVQRLQENLVQMQQEGVNYDKRLTECEIEVAGVEAKRAEVAKKREVKEMEVIDQTRKLKQLDVEMAMKDAELRESSNSYEGMVSFAEKMLRQLESFEQENKEVVKAVSGAEELQTAADSLEGVIGECKAFLSNL